MLYSIHGYIRKLAKDVAEGEVTVKFRSQPKVKPPRRRKNIQNKTNRSDFMQVYMEKYREEGNDYQKMPDNMKELRKKQKKERKKKEKKKASIKDVRVYNKALTPSEVGKIYIKSNQYPNQIMFNSATTTTGSDGLTYYASTENIGVNVNHPVAELCVWSTGEDNNSLIIS